MAKEHDESYDAVYRELGRRIRERRKALRLTQSDVAERTGIARASVANIELGKQRVSIGLLFAIGDAIKTEPRELLPCQEELLAPPSPIAEELAGHSPEAKKWLERVAAQVTSRRDDATKIPKERARSKKSTRRARSSGGDKATGTR